MRTLEDIIPPSRRSAPPGAPPRPPEPGRPPKRGRFPYLVILVIILIVGGVAVALAYASTAKIEITPSVTSVSVDSSFAAGGTNDLPFSIITATKTANTAIPASGSQQVSTSASGSITIYNAQSKPQTLIANTRFATPSGLIFRIHKAVSIPAGSTASPGSVTATAYADAPGDTYNIGPSSFSVPGLAGTPEEKVVYARSTAAMTGGATGTVPTVDSSAEATAVDSLESSMAAELQSSLAGQVPAGYVLIKGAATTTYRELTPAPAADASQASIQVEGTATGVIFPSAALASAIAAAGGEGTSTQGGEMRLSTGAALTLAPAAGFPATSADEFSFSLSGTAELVAKVDPGAIATAVAGKSRAEAQIALTSYPEVDRAILVLRPFWRTSFPEDPSAITVTVVDPAAASTPN